jgi:hypothetical protein
MIDPAYHSTDKPTSLTAELYVRPDNVNSLELFDLGELPVGAELDFIVGCEDRDRTTPVELPESEPLAKVLANGFSLAPYEVELELRSEDGTTVVQSRLLRLEGRLPANAYDIYNVYNPPKSEGCCTTGTFRFLFVPTNADADPEKPPSAPNHWVATQGRFQVFLTLRDAARHEYGHAEPIWIEVP